MTRSRPIACLALMIASFAGCGQEQQSAEWFDDHPVAMTGTITMQQPVTAVDATGTMSIEEAFLQRDRTLLDKPAANDDDDSRGSAVPRVDNPLVLADARLLADPPGADGAARAEEPKPADGKPVVQVPDRPADVPRTTTPDAARRIIHRADVMLRVDDLDEAARKIDDLLAQSGGYVVESDRSSYAGAARHQRWVLRVPVPKYKPFLNDLGAVGELESLTEKGQDVSQEFVDLEARATNQKRLEDRLAKLLEDRAGALKDAIEVERELARVRSEIETMEGRLRFLRNQTALSTVSILARERKTYVPPQAPSFGGRVARVWGMSVKGLLDTGEVLALFAVAIVPWLIPTALAAGGVRCLWTRRAEPRRET